MCISLSIYIYIYIHTHTYMYACTALYRVCGSEPDKKTSGIGSGTGCGRDRGGGDKLAAGR